MPSTTGTAIRGETKNVRSVGTGLRACGGFLRTGTARISLSPALRPLPRTENPLVESSPPGPVSETLQSPRFHCTVIWDNVWLSLHKKGEAGAQLVLCEVLEFRGYCFKQLR